MQYTEVNEGYIDQLIHMVFIKSHVPVDSARHIALIKRSFVAIKVFVVLFIEYIRTRL